MELSHLRVFGVVLGLCVIAVMPRYASSEPTFAEPIPNTTATVGRKASLKCTIDEIDAYKVAWIKLDTQTLLSYHTHVITRDRRLSVTNSNNRQWFLHITDVNVDDRGYYMCQINTEPMISQAGYLDIMVPPSITEEETSTDTVVDERSHVSLRCGASGYPTPQISWRRENNKNITLGQTGNQKNIVNRVEGQHLNLTQVTREDMGAYLCIASNKVPPSVSKRILLQVNFQPKIRVTNQMVKAVVGTDAILGCSLEASPKPLTSWTRHDGVILITNKKYELHEIEDSYKVLMQLKIKDVNEKDFGHYKCVAKNTFGEKEGFVRLIEIIQTTTTTQPTIAYNVFVPIQRVVTDYQLIKDVTTSEKRDYGVPTTNSLRDESHAVSSEKQLRPAKVESRLEQEVQHKRTLDRRPPHPSKSANEAQVIYQSSVLITIAFISIIYMNLQSM